MLDTRSGILEQESITNTRPSLAALSKRHPKALVVLEVGMHSPRISKFFLGRDHLMLAANPRKVRAIYQNERKSDRSCDTDMQLHISKAGDSCMRRLLVSAAQDVLEPFGAEWRLKPHGLKLAERGGSIGKKTASIAVARKLTVLMLTLWHDKDIPPLNP